MGNAQGDARPSIHLLESESDIVARLALRVEDQNPVLAAMLLEEIDRAELYGPDSLPGDSVTLGSMVTYVDERSQRMRIVELVLPVDANIAEGRISILSLVGAALFGLRAGTSIDWPDVGGSRRRLRVVSVVQPPGRVSRPS